MSVLSYGVYNIWLRVKVAYILSFLFCKCVRPVSRYAVIHDNTV